MIEEKINGHSIMMFDNPEDMPVRRWVKYNKYMLVSGELGGSIEELVSTVKRIGILVNEDSETAITLLNNMVQSMYMINYESSPKLYAIAALVHSIDGKEYNDLTEEGLLKVVKLIEEWTLKDVNRIDDNVKKKVDESLGELFPALNSTSSSRRDEYMYLLLDRAKLQLNGIIEGVDNTNDIKNATVKIASFYKPKPITGEESADLQYERRFNRDCQILKERLNENINEMTVVGFYSAFEYLKEISQSKPRRGPEFEASLH